MPLGCHPAGSVEARIEEIVRPALNDMGYDIVRIKMSGGDKRASLQIMADRLDGEQISLDECAKVSRTCSALIDVEDPIRGAFNLEVSSPGIDRPLTRQRDFERYRGHEVKVETDWPIEGRKRFRGPLTEVRENGVTVEVDQIGYDIAFDQIRDAKLMLTDRLIEESQKARKSA